MKESPLRVQAHGPQEIPSSHVKHQLYAYACNNCTLFLAQPPKPVSSY